MLHTHVYFSRMCYQIAPRVLHFSAFIILLATILRKLGAMHVLLLVVFLNDGLSS